MRRRVLIVGGGAFLAGCATRPSFVPKPSQAYARFDALRELRPAVPVGALWVEGFGAFGAGASPDNLVTEPGLRGISFDNDLQASFTAGFLQFLDLDPSYRSKFVARFSDLSVVRVKDMAQLTGPPGEPRIYAALKASSILLTAVQDIGLDIDARLTGRDLNVVGRGTTGQARTFTIDGKDMFFAIQVATFEDVRGREKRVEVKKPGRTVLTLERVKLDVSQHADGACGVTVGHGAGVVELQPGATARLPLPVPLAEDGSLYTGVELHYDVAGYPEAGGCRYGTVRGKLVGSRMRFERVETGTWRSGG